MLASRLLSILMLLQARGRMTSVALAEALQVSTRTILRDVDALSAAGVPLWADRGRQGGIQLQPGWHTQLTGLTAPEAQALLLAGLPGPAAELGLGAAAASARRKMVASLPSHWRDQAEQVGQRLHLDPVDWYRAPDAPQFLREVADAVWRSERIVVDYERWQGQVRRTLEPLGLVLKAGAWYVVARSAGSPQPRTYRLASLRTLAFTGHVFTRPRAFSLAEHWQASARRFEASLRGMPARLRVSPRALSWLANSRLPATPVTAASTSTSTCTPVPAPTRAQADWQTVDVALESVEQGARQLLGFGAEVEVLSPPELRAELQQQLAALQRLYRQRRPAAPLSPPEAS